MAKSTPDDYVRAVQKISQHYYKMPDQITEDELRQYFLYLKNVKKYGRSAIPICPVCGKPMILIEILKPGGFQVKRMIDKAAARPP